MSPATMPKATTPHHKQANSPLSHIASAGKVTKGTVPDTATPEVTQPVLVPRHRLTRRDVQPVDSHSLVMALMSGLLMESNWALDTLNILLRDDSSMSFCQLDTMPGLLDSLVEHWRDTKECISMGGKEEHIKNVYGVRRTDKLGELSVERMVLMNRKVQSVTLVQDSEVGTEWLEDEEWPVVGHIVRCGVGRWTEGGMECEALNMVGVVEEQAMSKLAVVTTVLRNLTSVIGNEEVIGRHTVFLSQCGEVLTSKETVNCLELENVMVSLANIGLYTDLSVQPSKVVLAILTSLLYWAVSDSSMGIFSFTSSLTLTPHKMALEILCKLCLRQSNTNLLLATPPREWLDQLCKVLAKKLYKSEEQAIREMSISILHYISSASTPLSLTISLHTPTIPLLITFIEHAEEAAHHVARHQGVAALRDNPSSMGTSLATLRRAADILATLAQQSITSSIFMREEQRLMNLAMSQIVDQEVARSICEVMYLASKEDETGRRITRWGW